MVLIKCSVSVIKPLASKQSSASVLSTTLKATVTTPPTKPVTMFSKRIKPAFTLYGSQSTTSFYPKRTFVSKAGTNSRKFNADLKVTGTIQEYPILSAVKKTQTKEGNSIDYPYLRYTLNILSTFLKSHTPAKVMNFNRWSPLERSLLIQKIISMKKNPKDFKRNDYIIISDFVGTRTPQQCYNYVRYHLDSLMMYI